MKYLRDWLRNIVTTLLIIIIVGIGMLIFMKIFYPDTIPLYIGMGQFSVLLANGLKLWPILILWFIVSALPRRRRRR
jgi:hypothetical protein